MFFRLVFLFLIMFSNYAISSIISQDYEHSNIFILRLGSCPTSSGTWGYEKEDNSYREWLSQDYRRCIEKANIPFKNIIHNYITEVQPIAMKWAKTPIYFHINNADELPTNIVADFNSERFNSGISSLMAGLRNAECLFDCIITDDRTTKFLHTSGLSNVISMLKIGGIAIFTDLDEDYAWQYDKDCMFCKQTKETFQKFMLQEPLPYDDYGQKYGLFDLVFGDCPKDGQVDSEYLRHHCVDVPDNTILKVHFYINIFRCYRALRASNLPLKGIIEYLLHLGNNKRFSQESRIIVLKKIE